MGQSVNLIEVSLDVRGGGTGEVKGNVIIFPGGAYQWHSPREAFPVAKAFAERGWKPWILYYEVSSNGKILGTTPLRQAAEAVRAVRSAGPGKPVILCGFSAGGHAAASLGVHWNDESLFAKEDQAAVRPDGLILGYPVITAGKYAHNESMEMLSGTGSAPDRYFSLEEYVDRMTPPAFIWHTAGDRTVSVQNALCFANRLADKGVPFELHIYPYGEHGLSLATREVEEPEKQRYADPHVAGWFEQCVQWLEFSFCTRRSG